MAAKIRARWRALLGVVFVALALLIAAQSAQAFTYPNRTQVRLTFHALLVTRCDNIDGKSEFQVETGTIIYYFCNNGDVDDIDDINCGKVGFQSRLCSGDFLWYWRYAGSLGAAHGKQWYRQRCWARYEKLNNTAGTPTVRKTLHCHDYYIGKDVFGNML